jgi:hypothetical protein
MNIKRLAGLAGASVVLAACSLPLIGQSPSPSPTAAARPSSTGKIAIAQPAPNTVVTTTMLHVEFQLTGAHIVDVTTKNLTPDTGHIHLSIDSRLISMNYQLSQDVSMQPFAPGPHVLQGEFVAADHIPFDPRVIAKVIIEYQPPATPSP